MNVWRSIQEFKQEKSSSRRKNIFHSLLETFLGPGSELTLSPVCTASLEARKQDKDPDAATTFAVLEAEVLALLQLSGVAESCGRETNAVRRAREWVFGPSDSTAEELKRRLQRYNDVAPPLLARLDTATREELHLLIKILLPLVVTFNHPVANELQAVFGRLDVVDPLSAKALRRKAITLSFVLTHTLSSSSGATLRQTVSAFRSGASQSQTELVAADGQSDFTNAVEAFSQGRNFNKTKKSIPDLEDSIETIVMFDGLKKDPVLRGNLLRVQQFFQASALLDGSGHRLLWYW